LLTIKGAKALAEGMLFCMMLWLMKSCSFALALKIFVGKEKVSCAYSQDEINQLIVDNALTVTWCD
jgi:uroporphyrin-III C-methyltransferase